jgi:hypothetical protein
MSPPVGARYSVAASFSPLPESATALGLVTLKLKMQPSVAASVQPEVTPSIVARAPNTLKKM